jgi:glycosyltransferase involved in cell wall biosynthesis
VCDFPPGFTAASYRGRGAGGTEALVVLEAEELARRGRHVVVATPCVEPARCEGVSYMHVSGARAVRSAVTVLVKHWSPSVAGRTGVRVFLPTDVHVPDKAGIRRCVEWAHHVCAMSDYQRSRVQEALGVGAFVVIGVPVAVDEYAGGDDARDPVLLYCSMPDRGLYYLQHLFPAIRRHVPGATLVITSDFTLWAQPAAKGAFMRFFEGQPGVEYLGHVPRAELVRQQQRARVMGYPCRFEEGFCIAAAECMAAGTVPITTKDFALVTTVGDAGVLLRGRPRGWCYRRAFVRETVRLLLDDEAWTVRSRACREHVREHFHPARVVDRLEAVLAGGTAG